MSEIQTCPITLSTREEIENAGGQVLNVIRDEKLVQIYDIDEIAKWLSHHTLYPHLDKPTDDEILIIKEQVNSFELFVPPFLQEENVNMVYYYGSMGHNSTMVTQFMNIQIVNSVNSVNGVDGNLLDDLIKYFSTYFNEANFKNANIYLIGNKNRALKKPRRKCFGIFKGKSIYEEIKTIKLVRIYITEEDEICCNFNVATKKTVNRLRVSFFSNEITSMTPGIMMRNDNYWATYEYFDRVSDMSNNEPFGSKIVYSNATGEIFFNKTDKDNIQDFSYVLQSVLQGGSSIKVKKVKKLHNQSIVLAGIKNENLIQDIIRLGGVVRTKPSGKTTLVVIPRRDYKSAVVTFAKTKNIKIVTTGLFCKDLKIGTCAIPDTITSTSAKTTKQLSGN